MSYGLYVWGTGGLYGVA
jgi:hypothetical protein